MQPKKSVPERRRSERFSPDHAPKCAVIPSGLSGVTAIVVDLSTVGAGLLLPATLSTGQLVTLRLGRPGLSPLEVEGRVVYSSGQGSAALLGCEFLELLDEADVRAVLLLGA